MNLQNAKGLWDLNHEELKLHSCDKILINQLKHKPSIILLFFCWNLEHNNSLGCSAVTIIVSFFNFLFISFFLINTSSDNIPHGRLSLPQQHPEILLYPKHKLAAWIICCYLSSLASAASPTEGGFSSWEHLFDASSAILWFLNVSSKNGHNHNNVISELREDQIKWWMMDVAVTYR